MALVNPFLLPTKTHLALHVSPPPSKRALLSTNPSSIFNFNRALSSRRRKQARYIASAADIKAASTLLDGEEDEKVLVGPSSEQERKGDREVADYDWTEEWYPLYLTKNVPHDAPLGLKVYDKNVVLFRDDSELMHPVIQNTMDLKHLYQVAAVAVLCVQAEPSYRPLITDVLHSLIPLVPLELGGSLRVTEPINSENLQ